MLDLSSRSLSLDSKPPRLCAVSTLAWSTTRPVSGGKSSANAMLVAINRTRVASGDVAILTAPHSELYLRRGLRTLIRCEFRHGLFAGECCLGPDNGWKRAQRGVIGPHRVDIVASRHGNAVFSAL